MSTAVEKSNDTFVLTDDIFALCKTDEDRIGAFANAFMVPIDVFKGAYDARIEAELKAEQEAKKGERVVARIKSIKDAVDEELKGFDLSQPLISRLNALIDVAAEMSTEDDGEVKVGFTLGFNEDGDWNLIPTFTGDGVTMPKKKGGSGKTRKSYTYFDSGTAIVGHLKAYVLENYPNSDAAKDIAAHDDDLAVKFGVERKKGSKSAFDCVEDDEVLSKTITRTEKVKTEE